MFKHESSKEIHFYTGRLAIRNALSDVIHIVTTWDGTAAAIKECLGCIHTTQMGCLAFHDELFENGYRIFIHDSDGQFEIRIGQCDRTSREIRRSHNLFKMWLSGEFDT